jgi:hypothetical protein
MMKKDEVIIFLIATFQLVLSVFSLFLFWESLSTIIPIFWSYGVFSLVYAIVAITGSIGLIWRKQWGRWFSIVAMGLIALFVLFLLVLMIVNEYQHGIADFSIYDLIPILIMLVLLLVLLIPGILSIVYLFKPRVKELFQKKPIQAQNLTGQGGYKNGQ